MMMELVIATTNFHKILELRAMIRSQFKDIEILSLKDFPSYEAPNEFGNSFLEIAEHKALHASKSLGLYVLADDSGLVVPALNGEPGIKSRRYAGEDATDKENRDKIIEKLKQVKDEERFAFFECALSFASPDHLIKTIRGKCEGHLLLESRGRGGFGYDPLFMKHDYNKTFAELEEDIKNRISHRRKAFDKLTPYIESELLKVTSLS
jgi:XTP/dITP diphosphohydrolase